MKRLMLRPLFLLFVLVSPTSFALSKLGHQLVCHLSFNQLDEPLQQKIQYLLTFMPVKEKQRINKYNHRPKKEEITLAKACTWPDAIKHEKKYKTYKKWHYLNVPRNTSIISTETINNNCKQECVTYAIKYHTTKFKEEKDPWERLQALMFLGHWLGDIHQPLHISFASDLGGNKTKMLTQSKCNNLHWYWDECLLKSESVTYKKQLEQLTQLWNRSPAKQWQDNSITDWANESFQIIKHPDFLYCQQHKSRCKKIKSTITLSNRYKEKHLPILQKQLVKASVRLNSQID